MLSAPAVAIPAFEVFGQKSEMFKKNSNKTVALFIVLTLRF